MPDAAVDAKPAQAAPLSASQRAISRLLAVVWMSIALGFSLQVVILVAKLAAGAPWPGSKWLPDLLNGVSWAVFVCSGVVLGTLASKARAASMGLLGLISAPLAFSLAKGAQRGLQSVMGAPVDRITPALYALCAVKAVEYACLGAVVAWLLARPAARGLHFVLAGLAAGVVFGGMNIWITIEVIKAKPPAVVGAMINELLFPIGCALVIYVATVAGRHVAALQPRITLPEEPSTDAGVPVG
jgi:hypothetical protein